MNNNSTAQASKQVPRFIPAPSKEGMKDLFDKYELLSRENIPLEEHELLGFEAPNRSTFADSLFEFLFLDTNFDRQKFVTTAFAHFHNKLITIIGNDDKDKDKDKQFIRNIIVVYYNRSLYDIDMYIEFYEMLILLNNVYESKAAEPRKMSRAEESHMLKKLKIEYEHVVGEKFSVAEFTEFINKAKVLKVAYNSNSNSNSNADSEFLYSENSSQQGDSPLPSPPQSPHSPLSTTRKPLLK